MADETTQQPDEIREQHVDDDSYPEEKSYVVNLSEKERKKRRRQFKDDAQVSTLVRDQKGMLVEKVFEIKSWRQVGDRYEYQLKDILTGRTVDSGKWFKETELDHP